MPSSELKKLRSRLERIKENRMQLQDLEEHYQAVVDDLTDLEETVVVHLSAGQTLKDSIVGVLEREGHPLRPETILDHLKRKNIHVPGQSPINNVRAHMSGDDRCEPVGDGTWKLVSWSDDDIDQNILDMLDNALSTGYNGNHGEQVKHPEESPSN